MDEKNKEQYYAIDLDDYATPGFCSWIKTYFGTMQDIERFVSALPKEGGFIETAEALAEYKKGNLSVKHHVAYAERQLLTPVEVVEKSTFKLDAMEWEHLNIYDCPYGMKIDGGIGVALLVKLGDAYWSCYEVEVRNLSYYGEVPADPKTKNYELVGKWFNLNESFWGHPAVLSTEEVDRVHIIKSSLYLPWKGYGSREEAIEDMKNNPIPELSSLCEEVFGDG